MAKTPLDLDQILEILRPMQASLLGEGEPAVRGLAPLGSDGAEDSLTFALTFCSAELAQLLENHSPVAFVPEAWEEPIPGKILLRVPNPRLAAARVATALDPDDRLPEGIHPDARVADDVPIGEGVRIGAFAVVGSGVRIGHGVRIHEHATVGSTGFGFVRNEEGALDRFPQTGTVVLEDGVEVFAHANVDRGALGETRVGEGTKLDHYVHVGHNSTVGRHSLLCARVVLAGGARVGDRCFLGVATSVKEKVRIGDEVTTGMGAVVIRDVEDGRTVAGVPARPIGGTE